jgi:hypothetical protein
VTVTWTWEKCVRDIIMCADPVKLGDLSTKWDSLGQDLTQLNQDVVGRRTSSPNSAEAANQLVGGLVEKLAGWKGPGGDAYREHIAEIGKAIGDLEADALKVSSALSRLSQDLSKAFVSIPIPVKGDISMTEWNGLSLPNDTKLNSDNGNGKKRTNEVVGQLLADYGKNPASYADGAFLKMADDLDETIKLDGKSGWNTDWRGGFYDTKSFLKDWYNDCTKVARNGATPVPRSVADERPNLTVGTMQAGTYTNSSDQTEDQSKYTPPYTPSYDGTTTSSSIPSVDAAYSPGTDDWLTGATADDAGYGWEEPTTNPRRRYRSGPERSWDWQRGLRRAW